MPAQQRRWLDKKRSPPRLRQNPGERSQHRTVGQPHARSTDLAPEHVQLMPQHKDLHLLCSLGPTKKNEQLEEAEDHPVGEGHALNQQTPSTHPPTLRLPETRSCLSPSTPTTTTAAREFLGPTRLYLLEQLVVQPFKQAFRELYVLTPAEEQTRVYSNRFAGHVFRQVQARALMKGRGWQPVPVAWWDDGIDHGVARRTFESFAVRAEFFFDPILDIQPDTSDLYPYCTSDQVRFFDVGSNEPMEIVDVPLLVFTETMRDVDLFVGVTSIGADPEWLDRGEGRRFETYWHTYSFGELTAAGEIRRDVLEQLLPRLAIADRCELGDRYLTVRGDLRTYRIHLGSGNILMSPNDQYPCIVVARDSRAEKLFLPFDDDPVLSLILSKAFLLANDTAITDKTIARQIQRG
jgi:Domain of unknown function (DUF4132)